MKRLLLTAFTGLLISYSATSQITKGTWLVGGSGSLYSYNENYSTPNYNQTSIYTNIDITASAGYFMIDKFAIGLRPYFSSNKGEATSPGGGSTNSYQLAIGPFARYYFLNTEKQFNILVDVGYQFGINKYLGALHENGKINNLSIMGGSEVLFNSTVGMEILLGYSQKIISIENAPGAFNSTKNGLQISIGFVLHLENL